MVIVNVLHGSTIPRSCQWYFGSRRYLLLRNTVKEVRTYGGGIPDGFYNEGVEETMFGVLVVTMVKI